MGRYKPLAESKAVYGIYNNDQNLKTRFDARDYISNLKRRSQSLQ